MVLKFKRLLSGIIDFYIICALSTAVVGIFTFGEFNANPFSITIYLIFYFLFVLIKDLIFKNASIGKRIFKLKVVKTDGTELMSRDVIKRNIFVAFLLPVEILSFIINNRRVGDILAKTEVVYKD